MQNSLNPTYCRQYDCSMQIQSQTANILVLAQSGIVQSIKHIEGNLMQLFLGDCFF
jgi:hypothetical protein